MVQTEFAGKVYGPQQKFGSPEKEQASCTARGEPHARDARHVRDLCARKAATNSGSKEEEQEFIHQVI